MHRVSRLAVLSSLCAFLLVSTKGQSVLEGEFGASRKGDVPKAVPAQSAEAPAVTASVQNPPAKTTSLNGKRYPYHGTLELVDPEGQSITLAGKKKQRVILITSGTNITRDGKSVTLGQALKGERVSGSVVKNEEGREQALTLRLRGVE